MHDVFPLTTLLTGDSIADSYCDQLQDYCLSHTSSYFLIFEEPIEVVDIVFVGDLPPLFTEECYVSFLLADGGQGLTSHHRRSRPTHLVAIEKAERFQNRPNFVFDEENILQVDQVLILLFLIHQIFFYFIHLFWRRFLGRRALHLSTDIF